MAPSGHMTPQREAPEAQTALMIHTINRRKPEANPVFGMRKARLPGTNLVHVRKHPVNHY